SDSSVGCIVCGRRFRRCWWFFFFSSRRRHTRWPRDWSSDVCSSDLYTRQNIEQMIVLDGHENFLEGQGRGKGVLYLTGHIGAWELSSFAHALYGFPLHYLARPIENRRIDGLVNGYRCLSGNQPIFKNESARV